jgi:hypothetical protein
MSKTINKIKKNKSVLMVIWQDAAFSNRASLPLQAPPQQITFGLFLGETARAINVGMNCHLNPKTKKILECRDAFLIPKKVIKEIKVIKTIND